MPTDSPPRTVPDVTLTVDRIVLEDPGMGPGDVDRFRDEVRARVTALLQEGRRPGPPPQGVAEPPPDDRVEQVAHAIVAAVRDNGGARGNA